MTQQQATEDPHLYASKPARKTTHASTKWQPKDLLGVLHACLYSCSIYGKCQELNAIKSFFQKSRHMRFPPLPFIVALKTKQMRQDTISKDEIENQQNRRCNYKLLIRVIKAKQDWILNTSERLIPISFQDTTIDSYLQ